MATATRSKIEVWEGVDGGVLSASNARSIHEFAEAVVFGEDEGKLDIFFEEDRDYSQTTPEELVSEVEAWIEARDPRGFQLPSELLEKERWSDEDEARILEAELDADSIPGHVKIITVSY